MKHFCVIGFPVAHSRSPKLFNRVFRKLGIAAKYSFAEVAPKELGKFMHSFRRKFAGASVTIPHKEKIIKYLDCMSPEARKIGAVNTIVNRGGMLVGYNTDVFGAMEALKSQKSKVPAAEQARYEVGKLATGQARGGKFELRGKNICVLGAGGASRAIVYGFKKAGARVTILNRTLDRACKLAAEFKCKSGGLADFNPEQCDILINATSVGMKKVKSASQKSKVQAKSQRAKIGEGEAKKYAAQDETPLPDLKKLLSAAKNYPKPLVMDIVYTPRMTRFLRDAKRSGCKIVTGDKMFLAQAQAAFKLWTGRKMPAGKMPR